MRGDSSRDRGFTSITSITCPFTIYLRWVFREEEQEVEGCRATLFTDDCGWLVVVDSQKQLYEPLERAEIKVVK